ncbi:hypothetical protein ACFWXK_27100 [Streptomyces sp. NPDC059070]|uniref:hypothetical protein n=1 Tax=Streptomyces sp. NPDC059070 TaxID=3346713 RepID=UPI0036B5B422
MGPVQRAPHTPSAPPKAAPLLRPAASGSGAGGRAPLAVTALTPPTQRTPAPLPSGPAAPATAPTRAPGNPGAPAVQRQLGQTIGALASAVSSTVGSTFAHLHRPSNGRSASGRSRHDTAEQLPAYSPLPPGGAPPGYPARPVEASGTPEPPPGYTEVPKGAFNPRELTEFQLDELVHRISGRITRHIRTELRLDRERIGRLRDTRR